MASQPETTTVDLLPEPGGLAFQTGLGYLLGRTGAIAYQQWTDILARREITPSQYKILMALQETGPLGQQHLAALVAIDQRNAVPVIETLVKRGLISRQINPHDRRRRTLTLTPAGRRLTDDLASVSATNERELLNPLSTADQQRLRRMLLALLKARG